MTLSRQSGGWVIDWAKRSERVKSRLKHSLRTRLLSSAFLWMSLVLMSAAIFLPRVVENYLYSQLSDQVNLYLDDLTAFVDITPEGEPVLLEPVADPRFRKPYSGWYWQINTPSHTLRSRSLWDSRTDLSQMNNPNGARLFYMSRELRLGELDTPIIVAVGVDDDSIDDTLEILTGGILGTLGAIALSMLALLWWQIRWSLKPMHQLQKDLQSVRDGSRDKLGSDYPAEVQPVADDLNVMLFHYSELLERARSHTGNLAHALKTPLSIIHNEIEHLPVEQQQRLKPAVQQLQDRMNYHLGRARVAGAVQILSVQSCPADVVDNITMVFEQAYQTRNVVLVNELDDELKVGVDVRDLEEMLGNLIENAFKWSSGLIRVHSETDEDCLTLYVEDNGPGLPEEQMEKALQRWVRMDEKTPGSGLGLNIVGDIANSYQGSLDLSSSMMGGLGVQLRLPLPRSQ